MKAFFRKFVATPIHVATRSQHAAFLFYRYGLAESLGALGIEVGKRGLTIVKLMHAPSIPLDRVFGKKLAKTFIKLGPTFIKLGQILATRPDFVGDPVCEELRILFDRVPPIPFKEVQRILRTELGKKRVEEAFDSIEPKPLASASLSQTHRAVLKDGTPVILKVQKTGVAELVRVDLVILEGFVRSVHLLYPKLGLLQIFEDFKSATLREIDYRQEAQNIDRFHKNYHRLFSKADVVFPRYFAELTTERVIALEPLHGKRIMDLRKGSTVARYVASAGLSAILEQIFDHGFFHADPHAGNLFFLEEEGRLGFIDLGLVGHLDPKDKRQFLKVLLAILQRDRKQLARALYDLGTPGKKTKYPIFEKAIQGLLDEVKKEGVNNMRIDQLVNRLLVIARKNYISIPNRYIMMIRSCLVIEGVAKSLDPKLSVANIAIPILARSLMKSYNPLRAFKKLF